MQVKIELKAAHEKYCQNEFDKSLIKQKKDDKKTVGNLVSANVTNSQINQ